MKQKSRVTALLLLLVLVTSLLGACSTKKQDVATESIVGTKDKESDTSEPAKEEVNLVFYHWDTTGIVQEQIDSFEASNPNINVELVLTPNKEYMDKLKISLAGGETIDIYASTNGASYSDVAVKYNAVPLNDFINQEKWDIGPFGTTINNSTIDGNILGIPTAKNGFMLFYNKKLFDEAGVPYPSDDMTWDEYADLAKLMTKGEGETKVWGSFMQNWAQLWYMPQIQKGQTIFDDNLSAAKEGLMLREKMQNTDFSEMPWAEVTAGKIHHRDAFASGNIAMMVIGDWMISILNTFTAEGKIDFEYDITNPPHPAGIAAGTTIGGPAAFISINGTSEYKAEAWEFIKFLTGKEGSLMYAAAKQSPAFVDDEIIKAYLGESPAPKNLEISLKLNPLPIFPFILGSNDIDKIMTEEGELVFVGEKSIDEGMEDIVERRAEALEQYQ
jgi:multiple sugar transport system substrate-binding protein